MSVFELRYEAGVTARFADLAEALDEIARVFPNWFGVHEAGNYEVSFDDADINGGDEGCAIVIWRNEESSLDDDGRYAVARIYKVEG